MPPGVAAAELKPGLRTVLTAIRGWSGIAFHIAISGFDRKMSLLALTSCPRHLIRCKKEQSVALETQMLEHAGAILRRMPSADIVGKPVRDVINGPRACFIGREAGSGSMRVGLFEETANFRRWRKGHQ
jgi:hypothetical protein